MCPLLVLDHETSAQAMVCTESLEARGSLTLPPYWQRDLHQIYDHMKCISRGTVESSRVGQLPKAFRKNNKEKAGKEFGQTLQDMPRAKIRPKLCENVGCVPHRTQFCTWLSDWRIEIQLQNFCFNRQNAALSSFPNFHPVSANKGSLSQAIAIGTSVA